MESGKYSAGRFLTYMESSTVWSSVLDGPAGLVGDVNDPDLVISGYPSFRSCGVSARFPSGVPAKLTGGGDALVRPRRSAGSRPATATAECWSSSSRVGLSQRPGIRGLQRAADQAFRRDRGQAVLAPERR